MIAVIGLLIIVIISVIVVRIGAISLELTGLSQEVAAFQAQSAFSGVGFTTSEAESVVNHPVRRKIARVLILVGSAGITSTIATLIVALMNVRSENFMERGGLLVAGLLAVYLLAKSQFVYRMMKKMIVAALSKNKSLKLHDYHEILGFGKGYSISRMTVKPDNWLVGQHLKDLGLHKEGTLILSIHRKVNQKDNFLIPSGDTEIQPQDQLTIYGQHANCDCLFNRPQGKKGDEAHKMRCEMEKKRIELQETEAAVH